MDTFCTTIVILLLFLPASITEENKPFLKDTSEKILFLSDGDHEDEPILDSQSTTLFSANSTVVPKRSNYSSPKYIAAMVIGSFFTLLCFCCMFIKAGIAFADRIQKLSTGRHRFLSDNSQFSDLYPSNEDDEETFCQRNSTDSNSSTSDTYLNRTLYLNHNKRNRSSNYFEDKPPDYLTVVVHGEGRKDFPQQEQISFPSNDITEIPPPSYDSLLLDRP